MMIQHIYINRKKKKHFMLYVINILKFIIKIKARRNPYIISLLFHPSHECVIYLLHPTFLHMFCCPSYSASTFTHIILIIHIRAIHFKSTSMKRFPILSSFCVVFHVKSTRFDSVPILEKK